LVVQVVGTPWPPGGRETATSHTYWSYLPPDPKPLIPATPCAFSGHPERPKVRGSPRRENLRKICIVRESWSKFLARKKTKGEKIVENKKKNGGVKTKKKKKKKKKKGPAGIEVRPSFHEKVCWGAGDQKETQPQKKKNHGDKRGEEID